MKYNHRRSIRLKGYDYSQPGWYFITICTQNRQLIFGDIVDEKMVLNKFGIIVKSEWEKTSDIRHNIEIDQYIIMPNHLHGIIGIIDDGHDSSNGTMPSQTMGTNEVRTNSYSPQRETSQQPTFKSPSKTIGAIIRGFKSAVTKQINKLLKTPGSSVWQRNYYERIIRNEPELNRIRKYIIENPIKWQYDKYFSNDK